MRFVGTPIDGYTSPSGESEHQFWNNPHLFQMFDTAGYHPYYNRLMLYRNYIPRISILPEKITTDGEERL